MYFKVKQSNYIYDIANDKLCDIDTKVEANILDGKYKIDINGVNILKDKDWFKHYAILGMELEDEFKNAINDIKFVPILIGKHINNYEFNPTFKNPLVRIIKNIPYRVIPRYPHYLISTDGIVINIKNNNPVRIWFSDQYKYNYCTIKDNYYYATM